MLARTGGMMLAVLFLAGLVANAAQSPDPEDESAKDLKMLQGTWTMTSAEIDGVMRKIAFSVSEVVIKGKSLHVSLHGHDAGEYAFALDGMKTPRELTLTLDGGNGEVKAIYSLQGEVFKLCFKKGPGLPRPTEFTSKGGNVQLTCIKKKS